MGYTTGMLGRTSESERCTHRSSGGRASAVTYLRVTEPGGARSSSPSFPPPAPSRGTVYGGHPPPVPGSAPLHSVLLKSAATRLGPHGNLRWQRYVCLADAVAPREAEQSYPQATSLHNSRETLAAVTGGHGYSICQK